MLAGALRGNGDAVLEGEAEEAVEFAGVDALGVEVSGLLGSVELFPGGGDPLAEFLAERVHGRHTLSTSCRILQFMIAYISKIMEDGRPRMTTPLHQLKAEFFKTLGHPARIRILELLSERETAVSELLPEVRLEASNLSQQLAVLRRAGLVTARRDGSQVYYSLTSPQVAELLAVARGILTSVLSDQVELLDGLRADAAEPSPARRAAR